MAKRKSIYWTPCAAHCIDLILEDIGKINKIHNTLKRAISLTGYIYNHTGVLSLMRRFTGKKELVRHGVTRFATTFLSLQSVFKQKLSLRTMFTSEEWVKSKWSKEFKGKKACETIFMPSFWNNVTFTLKVMGPIVRVLRLVDGDKRPAMAYIYEAMDRAKEAIQKAFNYQEHKYKDIFKIIDHRWEFQLHHPLHAAGHFLNPEFFYNDPNIEHDEEVTTGLYKCIERLLPDDLQEKVVDELSMYKRAEGQFGIQLAIKARKTKAPAEWWSCYGNSVPTLQKFAIKILSLTCSSAGCERNWSIFEHIHQKKRNRLEHEKLQHLVYIKYNQNLVSRFQRRNLIDPISLDDIDASNEWLTGHMHEEDNSDAEDELVFDDDLLTWGMVAQVAGVGERSHATRHEVKSKGKSKASSSTFRGSNLEAEEAETSHFEEENEFEDGSSDYKSDEELEFDEYLDDDSDE